MTTEDSFFSGVTENGTIYRPSSGGAYGVYNTELIFPDGTGIAAANTDVWSSPRAYAEWAEGEYLSRGQVGNLTPTPVSSPGAFTNSPVVNAESQLTSGNRFDAKPRTPDDTTDNNDNERPARNRCDPNILSQWDNVTYNLKFAMVSRDTINNRTWPDDTAWIVAETGVTTVYNIDNLEMIHYPLGPNGVTTMELSFDILEPRGLTLFDTLFLTASNYGYETLQTANYILEIEFWGVQPNGSEPTKIPGQIYAWPIRIGDIQTKPDLDATRYSFSAFVLDDSPIIEPVGEFDHIQTVENQRTVGEILQEVEERLNQIEESHLNGNAQSVPDEYVIMIDDALGALPVLPSEANTVPRNTSSTNTEDGAYTVTLPAGSTIPEIVSHLFSRVEEEAFEAYRNENQNINNYNQDDQEAAPLEIWRIETRTEIIGPDELRNEDARRFIYEIRPYNSFLQEDYDPLATEERWNDEGYQQSRAELLQVARCYNYWYTGQTTEVLNVDLSFNTLSLIEVPPNLGINIGSGPSEGRRYDPDATAAPPAPPSPTYSNPENPDLIRNENEIQISQEEADLLIARNIESEEVASRINSRGFWLSSEAFEALSRLDDSIAVNEDYIQRHRENIARLQEEQEELLRIEEVRNSLAGQRSVPLGSVGGQTIDVTGDATSPDSSVGTVASASRYIETLRDSRVENVVFNRYRRVTGSNPAQRTAGFTEETRRPHTSITSMIFNRLGPYGEIAQDWVNLTLGIKGDSYWLGKSLEGVNSFPFEERTPVVLFKVNFPSNLEEPDGTIKIRQENTITGYYSVYEIVSRFSNGQFIQDLTLVRVTDANPNFSIVSSGVPDEQPQSLNNSTEPASEQRPIPLGSLGGQL